MHRSYRVGQSQPIRQRKKFTHRRAVVTGLVVLIFAVAGYILWDRWNNKKDYTTPVSKSSAPRDFGVANVFRTDFFQFEDYGDWRLATDTKMSNKFVFRKYHGPLVEAELMVYVNNLPVDTSTSRVLPVTINSDGRSLKPGKVSDPCVKAYTPSELHIRHSVKLDDTTVICDPDTPQYFVLLAQKGGDFRLNLQRTNGQTAQYFVIYHDVTVGPGPDTITRLADSFRAL